MRSRNLIAPQAIYLAQKLSVDYCHQKCSRIHVPDHIVIYIFLVKRTRLTSNLSRDLLIIGCLFWNNHPETNYAFEVYTNWEIATIPLRVRGSDESLLSSLIYLALNQASRLRCYGNPTWRDREVGMWIFPGTFIIETPVDASLIHYTQTTLGSPLLCTKHECTQKNISQWAHGRPIAAP